MATFPTLSLFLLHRIMPSVCQRHPFLQIHSYTHTHIPMYIYSAQLRLWPDIGRKAETLKDIALPLSYQVAPMKRAHIPPIPSPSPLSSIPSTIISTDILLLLNYAVCFCLWAIKYKNLSWLLSLQQMQLIIMARSWRRGQNTESDTQTG